MINFNNIKYLASYALPEQLPMSIKPEIVFVGRSNVGKSSLINKLVSRKSLAKVSSTPGKTITINFYDNGNLHLVDLPGYGFAARSSKEISRWTNLIEGYFSQVRDIALVVALVDIRHSPTKQDIENIEFLKSIGVPFCVALTKADKLSKQKCINQQKTLSKLIDSDKMIQVITTSAQSGQGLDALNKHIQLAIC